jgi:hypothetical protein
MDMPPPVVMEHYFDHAQNYLGERGYRLTVPVHVEPAAEHPFGVEHAGAAIYPHTGRMQPSHGFARGLHQLHHAKHAPFSLSPITTVLHETLHVVNPDAPEGLVEAVAADLTKPFARRMGIRVKGTRVSVAYWRETQAVRNAAAGQCGQVWWSQCAKQVRSAWMSRS